MVTLCPDWMSKFTEKDVPRVSGKMALMPLPAWEPGGRRTTTLGGTMLGITKKCENKELAFKLAAHLYFNADDLAERFRQTNIIPPVKDAWDHPAYSEPREYWSGQPIGKMYAELAEDVPPQLANPFVMQVKAKMGEALSSSCTYYEKNGEKGFDEFVRKRLKQAADDIKRYMKRNPY